MDGAEFAERNFDDIEVLEIPDDDTTSETEGISDSSTTSNKVVDRRIYVEEKPYIELQEWLDSRTPLEFQFNKAQYNKSVRADDNYSQSYVKYVNSLYKSIESISEKDISRVDLETEEFTIGFTEEDSDRTIAREHAFEQIDQEFEKILTNLQVFLQEIESDGDSYDENGLQLHSLLYMLQCLHANYFYGDVKLKPEFIAKWVNVFYQKPADELAQSVMINTRTPYTHPQFWNTYVSQLITRGLLTQVVEVIAHSRYEELEESCPELYSTISDLSLLIENYRPLALKGQFSQWKLSACEFRDSLAKVKLASTNAQHGIMLSQIYDLSCIITGLPKTIAAHSETWYEVYVALSLYSIRDDNALYKEFYNVAITEKPPPTFEDESLDIAQLSEECFKNILEENFLKVLKTFHDLEPATASYVSKLLELRGYLNNYYSSQNNARSVEALLNKRTISEYFLTRHAFECLNIHKLVPVGIGLLLNRDIATSTQSIEYNSDVIANFLPQFKCETNDDLEWALTICAKLNLVSTAREMYYIYGLKSLEDGYVFEALNMFVNCYDPTSFDRDNKNEGMKQVHRIVWDMIFQDSLVNNRPANDDLINNIVTSKVDKSLKIHPVIRQCLSPYAVLNDFFHSLNSNELTLIKKFSKLIHLLKFSYLPKKFYPLLLSQYLPYLYDANSEFQLPDLIVIIDVIDSYYAQSSEVELKEGEELYQYSINHIEEVTQPYDWRILLQNRKVELPQNLKELIKTIRNAIVSKIGKVYIES
ncbi:protein in nuclear pore complex may function in nuclear envelope integrity may also be [Scheffersomyces xylosifermentans]|uniref:protein in nuclear pore complex may function in nuclear envelope integrity may also be n=1 Tax=Scheffersomyces xylosifermentans TaxID=1304137 RepID=UPI00315CD821